MNYKLINMQVMGDKRGQLVSLESNRNIPFEIKRVFYIYGTTEGISRGNHAHRNVEQVLIRMSGSCKVKADNGKTSEIFELNSSDKGLYLGTYVWNTMFDFSPDCVLLVLANDFYENDQYIKDYDEFLMELNQTFGQL